jgi:simple sugar transport system permease protein
MSASSEMGGKISAESELTVKATADRPSKSGNWLQTMRQHTAIWPLLALVLILIIDGIINPNFFEIRIVEGRLFGNLIVIFYRAAPTALVALGMALVIGTRRHHH